MRTTCHLLLTRAQLRSGDLELCIPVDAFFTDPHGRPAPPPPGDFASAELARRLGYRASHLTSRYPGGVICWKCGCWSSSTRAVGLRKPCNLVPTPSGALAIERVIDGRPARWQPRDVGDLAWRERAATLQHALDLQQRERLRRAHHLTEVETSRAGSRMRLYFKQPARLPHYVSDLATPALLSDLVPLDTAPAQEPGELDYAQHFFLEPAIGADDQLYLDIGEMIEAQFVGAEDDQEFSDPFARGTALG